MEKTITVTLQDEKETQERIPYLAILSVDEVWEKGLYLGTHIGSRNHFGWMVKERVSAIEKMIEAVGTRCYNYKCPPSCCPKGGMYAAKKDKN
jgi:hypothetical protein